MLRGSSAHVLALFALACGSSIASVSVRAQQADPATPSATTQLPEVVVQGNKNAKKPSKKKSAKAGKAKSAPVQQATIDPPPDFATVPQPSDGSSVPLTTTDGYVSIESSVATKTDTPVKEIPQSISTVTRKQLEDRKPQSLSDAFGYVPGTRVNNSGFDPRFDNFYIRGFDASYTGIYRDGLRQISSSFGQFRTEPYGLESITILRGPSSTLYGASNAGGIVDMYDKRPTATPFHEIELIGGSYDRFQGNFDFSGPVAPGSDVLYRLTGLVREANTEAYGVPDDRIYIAPAVSFKLDPDTKVTILGEYMDAKTGGNMAWWNDFSDPLRPRRTDIWSGDPNFNTFSQTQERIGYEIDHRVNGILTVRQKARYSHLDSTGEYIDIIEETAPNVWDRANGVIESNVHVFNMDNQAEARFATGPLKHTVLAGVDMAYVSYTENYGYGDASTGVPPLVNYNYGQQFIPTPDITELTSQKQFMIGTYLQDQIKLGRWILTLGGRHDWVDTKTTNDATDDDDPKTTERQHDEAWSGKAALSYLFDSGFAPYVAYGTSFLPNTGTDTDGNPFKAATAESKEVGFKYFVPGANASISSAIFDITQKNGLVNEPFEEENGIITTVLVQRGVLRSRGFEIEGNTTLSNGLSLLASYSYIAMQIEDDAEGNYGNDLSSIPRHTFSIWGDYTLRTGMYRGLGMGLGVRYIGTSFGNDENTFKNDAHALLDGAVHYDLGELDPKFAGARLQVNANNVFDRREDVCSSGYCYLDQGRMVIGSLRYRW